MSKTFLQQMAAELKDGKVKFPLACGCSGEVYSAKCGMHKNEELEDHAQRMGIADLLYPSDLLDTDQGRDQFIKEIRHALRTRPTKKLVIHIQGWTP